MKEHTGVERGYGSKGTWVRKRWLVITGAEGQEQRLDMLKALSRVFQD